MNLAQFLQDNVGASSSGRLMQVAVAAAILLVWLLTNVSAFAVSLSGHSAFHVVPMDASMLWAIGIVFGTNVAKTLAEGKEPPKV